MKKAACIFFCLLAVCAGASTTLEESFESLCSGSVDGQDSWSVESGNPGWTYHQAYIAGISPVSAESFEFNRTGLCSLSWDAKSSRMYDVLWTTNLQSGFTTVASNLVSQTEFADTSSNTNLPAGFYKLQVRVAP